MNSRFYHTFLFLVASLGALLLTACESRPKAPEILGQNSKPLAKIGSTIVTDTELLERIAVIEKTYPRHYTTHLQKKELLNEMINVQLLYEAALNERLDKEYEYKSRLADLYIRKLSEEWRSKIEEKDLKVFFEENKKNIEQISARHILLRVTPNVKAAQRSEKRKKIEAIRAEALNAPETFSELAKKYSEDASRDQGGELGYFNFTAMVPRFSTAAFNLKKINDISPVVETEFGFHIIQLSGDKRGYENYKDIIKDKFVRIIQRDKLSQEIEKLRSKHKIETYEDNLAALSSLPDEVNTDPSSLIPVPKIKNEKLHKKN